MTIETIQLDWRGMRCPEPILKTARKVRKLRDGTDRRIQIYADDDAFPMDIKSWCQSSGITLMGVEERDGYYEAILALGDSHASPTPPSSEAKKLVKAMRETIDRKPPHRHTPKLSEVEKVTTPDFEAKEVALDCLGMACPEPILKLARAYRKLDEGAAVTITADDDAFPVDIKSWLKSSGATLISLHDETAPYKATISKPSTTTHAESAPAKPAPAKEQERVAAPAPRPGTLQLQLDGLEWEDAMARLESMTGPAWAGETLEVYTSNTSHLQQIVTWLAQAGHQLVRFDAAQGVIELGISGNATSQALVTTSSQALVPANQNKRATFLVIHNDFESLMAALMIANTTAAQNIETSIFFSFWGVNLLRSDRPRQNEPKKPMTIIHRMFRWMMPRGPGRQPLSKMHFGGAGKAMMLASMRQQNVMDLETLMEAAIESGVQFTVCTMSMSIMGIQKRDIMERDNISFAGVASFVADSAHSDISMVF